MVLLREPFAKAPAEDPAHFHEWIDDILEDQDFSVAVAERWSQFLRRAREPQDTSILRFSTVAPDSPEGCFGVISRATLLLRVASGSNSELIRGAGLSAKTLSFWWKQLGRARGLWPSDQELPLADLWADIRPLLNDIQTFEDTHPIANRTFFVAARELGLSYSTLSSCERVGLWGLPSGP